MMMSGQMVGWFFVALSLAGALRMVIAPSFRVFVLSFLFCVAGAAGLAAIAGLPWLALFFAAIDGAMVFVMALARGSGGNRRERGGLVLAVPPALLLLAWLFCALCDVVPMRATDPVPGMGDAARALCGEMSFLLPSSLLLLMAAAVAALATGCGDRDIRLRQDWRWQMGRNARTVIVLSENGEAPPP